MMVQFDEKDYELLKSLLDITKQIKETYNDLYNLEVSGRKNTCEYDRMMDALKFYLNEEDNIYETLRYDCDRVDVFMRFIFENGMFELDDELEAIKFDLTSDIFKARIGRKLNKIFEEIEIEMHSSFSLEEEEENEELEEVEVYDIEDDMHWYDVIEYDLINTILAILNKCLNEPKYVQLKDSLIKMKYDISYIYEANEKELVENHFEINPVLYWKSRLVMEMQKREEVDFYSEIEELIDSLMPFQFSMLEALYRSDYDENEKVIRLAITEVYVRAFNLLVPLSYVKRAKNTFDVIMILQGKTDEVIENTIRDIFNALNEDKKLPNILSLNPIIN